MLNGRKSIYAAFLCAIFLASSCPVYAAMRYDPSPVKPVKKEDPPAPEPDDKKNTENNTSKNKDSKNKNKNIRNNKNNKNKDSKNISRNNNSKTPAKSPAHSRITDFRLSGPSPYAILTKAGGSTIAVPLVKDGQGFSTDTINGVIPLGTRLTVPTGYKVYCVDGHTRLISGKNFRADYNGRTMVQYDSGSEIEYTETSGMVIIASEFADDPMKHKPVIPTYDTDISGMRIARDEPDYENRSERPEDVIETYEISREHKDNLIRMHNEASRMLSKEGRAERYEELYEHYDKDYLAAYGVALAEFDMYHGRQCIEWCDIALSINRRYLPAKLLRNRAEGIL